MSTYRVKIELTIRSQTQLAVSQKVREETFKVRLNEKNLPTNHYFSCFLIHLDSAL